MCTGRGYPSGSPGPLLWRGALLSALQRVEVTFEGEALASFTSEVGAITYRLFRYDGDDDPGYFVHIKD